MVLINGRPPPLCGSYDTASRNTISYAKFYRAYTTKIGALTEATMHLSVYCVNLKPLAQKQCILELCWATVCKTVRDMLSDRCPVCDVRALWPNGWTD